VVYSGRKIINISNRKLILVAGMARGGTNILWNIVQSHPDVIDSYYELNEIYGMSKTGISLSEKIAVELSALYGLHTKNVEKLTIKRLAQFAKYSFENDKYNRYKFSDELYKKNDFDNLTICTKLVSSWEKDFFRKFFRRNDALKYISVLKKSIPNVQIVFLIRNGLAMAESWKRRGSNIQKAAKWYRQYVQFYEEYCLNNPVTSILLKFEDITKDPFSVSEIIYKKLGLSPAKLDKLRIALKPTIKNQSIINTTKKDKVWIDRENYKNILDDDVNNAQMNNLSQDEIDFFIKYNKDILEKYSYGS